MAQSISGRTLAGLARVLITRAIALRVARTRFWADISDRSNTGLFILAAFAFLENRVMKIWLELLLISLAIDDRSRVQ